MLIKTSPSALDAENSTPPGPSNEPIPPQPPSYEAIFQSHQSETSTHLQERKTFIPEMHSDSVNDNRVNQSDPSGKKREWHQRAKSFIKAGHETKRGVLREVGGLIHLAVSIPCLLVGTALHIVGGTVHAAASVVEGVGDAISSGSRFRDSDVGSRSIGHGNDGFQGKRRL